VTSGDGPLGARATGLERSQGVTRAGGNARKVAFKIYSMSQADVAIAQYHELLWPTLQALKVLGGSGSINEVVDEVVELEGFSEEQQAVPHGDGPTSEIA
jgi:hypothetical protein